MEQHSEFEVALIAWVFRGGRQSISTRFVSKDIDGFGVCSDNADFFTRQDRGIG